MTVTFTPVSVGAVRVFVFLSVDGVEKPLTVDGQGVTPAALLISPAPVALAPTLLGETSPLFPVTVRNTGQTNSGPLAVVLRDDPRAVLRSLMTDALGCPWSRQPPVPSISDFGRSCGATIRGRCGSR